MSVLCILPIQAQEEKQTVKVGYWENYGITINEHGSFYGYGYEYIMDIADINNWNIEFVNCDWDEGLQLLKTGEIDLFGMLQKTAERELIYAYPDENFGYEYGAIYINENNKNIYFDDPISLNGKIVGTVFNNAHLPELEAYSKEYNIEFKYEYYEDSSLLQSALDQGEIDLLFAGSINDVPRAKVVLYLQREPIYYATSIQNKAILDGLNIAQNVLKEESIYYAADMQHKYYNEASISLEAFTRQEREYIEKLNQEGALKVTFHNNWKPFDSLNPKTGEYEGISVDVTSKISEISGLEFDYVVVDDNVTLSEISSNPEFDIVGGMIDSKMMQEKYQLLASDSFFETPFVFVGKRGTKYLEGTSLKVAVPENSYGAGFHIASDYPDYEVVMYKDALACLKAVAKGQVNHAVLNSYAADEHLKERQFNNLAIILSMRGKLPISLGVKSNDLLLLSILDKSIKAIDEEELKEIINVHTIGIPYKPSFSEIVQQNVILIATIIFMFGVFFVVALYLLKRDKERELNKIAYYDPLTKNINFVRFKQKCEKALADKSNPKLTMLSIDIDKFKYISDSLGYAFGDKLLILLSDEIKRNLQEDEFYARENADKFIILTKTIDRKEIERHCEEFVVRFDQLCRSLDSHIKVILSIGFYNIDIEDEKLDAIIDKAHFARKSIKNNHKSSYARFDQAMYNRINNEKEIENIMDTALESHQFEVYLQPKFSVQGQRIVGAESLARWNHPLKGVIEPSEFIPIFEKNGFITNLDYNIFEQTCIMIKHWMDRNIQPVPISVNLSRRHVSNMNMPKELYTICQKYGVSSKYLELEITESTFVEGDTNVIIELMNELHKLGFSISMDDFGTGVSSLTQLKELPIDILKLDKTFLGQDENYRERVIFINLVKMAKDMGIRTIAEGVETKEQYWILQDAGCDMVQGYLFGKPTSIEEFEAKFVTNQKHQN